ncbi:histidine kinase [Gallaecimonas kandeliae]|uniref:sensor histidine kinase n=1 Tax=Gallaecimonas kandeliae TaxID=3029055 RepID=UPI0026473F08|nr:histidine kinase [Gallaecimonas kandeliae]WKE64773.1 histidine kinase [Gallaecimonas kandeliae]
MRLSDDNKKDLRLTAVCLVIGWTLYFIGWSASLGLSLAIALGMGFTVRYGRRLLAASFPAMAPALQFLIAALVSCLVPLVLLELYLPGDVHIAPDRYLGIILVCALIALAISYLFYRSEQSHALQQALDRAELERVKQDKELLETKLRLLQSQIEPHFLFNTLANIQALIALEPKTASKMLSALTALLRQSLTRTRDEWLTLEQELKFNEAYLAVQQIRLGERLRATFDIPDQLPGSILFPPMLLQPLIENAIVHGIEPLKDGGELRLSIASSADKLQISLFNSCPEGQQSHHKGHKIGVNNTRERLARLYGDQALFSLDHLEHGVQVYLEVPLNVTRL